MLWLFSLSRVSNLTLAAPSRVIILTRALDGFLAGLRLSASSMHVTTASAVGVANLASFLISLMASTQLALSSFGQSFWKRDEQAYASTLLTWPLMAKA